MKSDKIYLLLLFVIFALPVKSQNPVLHYQFNLKAGTTDTIRDESGNGYHAALMGSAKINTLGTFKVVETGNTSGYVKISSNAGQLISTLSNFTISAYLYVDPVQVLTNAGNFVWTFSRSADINSSATGCMFYSAKESRYVISKTNWNGEQKVSIASAAAKGNWKHIAYVQSGNTGTIYINGVSQKTGTVNLLPSSLGVTTYNYLFKSAYGSDQLLLNSKICEFRIYNSALNLAGIQSLAGNAARLDTLLFTQQAGNASTNLSLGNTDHIRSNLTLPSSGDYYTSVTWNSSNTSVINNSGVVSRPSAGSSAVTVQLTATITRNFISTQKVFNVTVDPFLTDHESVTADAADIVIQGNVNMLRSGLTLPVSGAEGSTVSWQSLNTYYLSNQGTVNNRPVHGAGNTTVNLRANIQKNGAVTTRDFPVTIAEDEGFAAYLFAYFTGNTIAQEAIRFAISYDGLAFTALNDNQPVISSSTISLTGGVRDPHILRGENNDYYMTVTDMVSANGWNSNRGLVLLKSTNLTGWTSAAINIPNTFPAQFGDVDRVWAPQTIYDPITGKYMVYFSMRKGSSDYDKIFYAYVNSSFTAFETVPQQLFFNPALTACIDGDMVYKDGEYHLFFKTEGSGNGIKKAVSSNISSGFVLLDKYLQQTTQAVEGSCVFRLYNTDNWVLIYDVYSSGYYQFTQGTDLENFTLTGSGVSMNFTPRHGTIIPITSSELQALRAKWDVTSSELVCNREVNYRFSKNNSGISIENLQNLPMNILITDLTGRCVLKRISKDHNFSINSLQKGIYIVKIGLEGKTYIEKIQID
jgi:hypothetical protein